jgi:hypothetical protein
MARDYAKFVPPKRRASKSKRRSGMLFPVFFALFVFSLAVICLFCGKKIANSWVMLSQRASLYFHHTHVNPSLAKPTKKVVAVAHDGPPPPVRFDFYNELPSMQMSAHSFTDNEVAMRARPDPEPPAAPAEKPKDSNPGPDDISKLLAVENNAGSPHMIR